MVDKLLLKETHHSHYWFSHCRTLDHLQGTPRQFRAQLGGKAHSCVKPIQFVLPT